MSDNDRAADSTKDLRTGAAWPATRWGSLIGADGAPARAPLEALARGYERPIRAWLAAAFRRQGDAAPDQAQDFFVWVIESGFLAKADPARGRFRTFLKVALRNFVLDALRARRAEKRGGAAATRPLHEALDQGAEPAAADEAGAALDREWRRALIERAVADVERELAASGRSRQFAVFRDYFLAPEEGVDYRALAERHAVSEVDVSNWLTRVKRLYRERLRALVLETVHGPDDLAAELLWFFGRGAR